VTGRTSDVAELASAFGALAHPIRIRAFTAFADGHLSPAELDRQLADPTISLALLSYHFRRLARAGLIELAATTQRRGAIEHRYALTSRGRILLGVLETLDWR
jgi:DNA-binding transcriptional ArsR family regulator